MVKRKRIDSDMVDGDVACFVARIVTEPTLPTGTGSLFVECPEIMPGGHFHTGTVQRSYEQDDNGINSYKDYSDFEHGEYISLVFEATGFGSHELKAVQPTDFSEPEGYETIADSAYPKVCPECGREAIAALRKDDKKYSRVYSDDADHCHVSEDRGRWFGIEHQSVLIH